MFNSRSRPVMFAVGAILAAAAPLRATAQERAVPPTTSLSERGAATPFLTSQAGDLLASNLIDVEVTGADGKRLGEIEDLVFDVSGQVRAVMVALGAHAGSGERHVLVQFTALHLVPGDGLKWRASLDATPDQLKTAPSIPYRNGWNE